MLGFLKAIFTGGGLSSITNVASELIDTPLEKAQAQVVKLKAMDPNGIMRRNLSIFACRAYGFYLINMVILSYMVAFGIGDPAGAEQAAVMMKDLFFPITTAWGTIVGASFGVNGINSFKGK